MAEVCYPQVKWLPQEFLLHDAVEAYVGDISSPLKSMLPGYRVIEERHKVALEKKFAVSLGGAYVKTVDLRMLATERDLLMPAGGSSWNLSEVPFTLEEFIIKSKVVHKVPVAIEPFWDWLWGPWTAEEAETNFLERMEKLKL
jgi:hypothetical protein